MIFNKKAQIFFIVCLFTYGCDKQVVQKKELLKEYVIVDINTRLIEENYTQHYYAGMFLAVKEINAKGGVNGLPFKVVTKNDFANHREAYLKAEEGVSLDKAFILTGTSYIQTTMGVARYAKEFSIPFIDTGNHSEQLITGDNASEWVFRLRSGYNTHMEVLSDSVASNNSIKSLVVITYSSEEGMINSKKFKEMVHKKNSKIIFSTDVYVAPQKTISDNLVQNIEQSYTTAVVILLDGSDIFNTMKIIQDSRVAVGKLVFMMFGGEPEWIYSLGNKRPTDWIVTGFPWYAIDTAANKNFLNRFRKQYVVRPLYSSYIGYMAVYLIAEALRKSKITSDDYESRKIFIDSLKEASFDSPIGLIKMRADNQSNMNTYVGILSPYDVVNKKTQLVTTSMRMKNSKIADADTILPPVEEVIKIRQRMFATKKNKRQIIPKE